MSLSLSLSLSLSVIDVCSDYRGHCRQIQLSRLRRICFYGFEESMDTCRAPVNEMPLNLRLKSRKPLAGIQMLSVCHLSLINVLPFMVLTCIFHRVMTAAEFEHLSSSALACVLTAQYITEYLKCIVRPVFLQD